MAVPRKPRPTYVTREQAAEMIAEAIAAERARLVANKPLGVRTSPTFRKK